MTRNEVVKQLEEVIAEATYPDRPRKFMMPLDLAEEALEILKAQEPVEPKRIMDKSSLGYKWVFYCGECGNEIPRNALYCPICGRPVKWDD